jgi:L-lactate dehydrogenase complex protein LldG
MSDREAFLEQVREAVRKGGQAGLGPTLPDRGNVGYQGGGSDPVAQFGEMLLAAGGKMSRAADDQNALAIILTDIKRQNLKHALLGCEPTVARLGIPAALAERGCEAVISSEHMRVGNRDSSFAADVAITGVDYLIAETGTIIMLARPEQPRTASLLPPVHIAIADRSQILPDLFDLYDRLDPQCLPSCVTHITGPSKTGDIELKLVTGVHGPGEVHVIVID